VKFYNRESELRSLEVVNNQCDKSSKIVVITGRRRVGKTLLSYEFIKEKPHLYLFVSKKSESLLCEEYVRQIKEVFNVPVIGKITEFKDIFLFLLELSKSHSFILVLDEFQEFFTINPSVFSDLQNLWDQYKSESKILVLFMGSVYSLMNKIFQDSKEPLFGRADRILNLRPFSISTIKEVLSDYNKSDLSILFNYYMITGGLPKYIDILVTNSLFSFDDMIDFIISENSPFLEEGKRLLIEEFGKEYAVYFSILELIASGKTSRMEIESILQKNVGGHIERLDKDYAIIKKYRPINAKKGSKLLKYQICDHFLRFWFRFIYRHRTAVEIGNFNYIKESIYKNIATYSGRVYEEFFYELFAASNKYNRIGSYWERGHTNEIDLVAFNDEEKKLVIAEIKRNKHKIDLNKLRWKAAGLVKDYSDYNIEYIALSLEDAKEYLS